jgi:23S rRNA pseudouridine2605 synthase
VTNDGELANKLTKASAGVEKTYLVKVAGIPSEAELDILRAGVAIEKGKPGSGKVRTSPARIRQVRQGDNPWYEVVLIEGRNRELRKMFEEVGHFVEKIRRVGYGPLILDQEPGLLRELDARELELLRKAADGKLRTPKAKEIRRRNIVDSLPPEKPAFKQRGAKPAAGPKDYLPKKSFGLDRPSGSDRPVRSGSGPARFGAGAEKFGKSRPAPGSYSRPAWKKDDRAARPPARFAAGPTGDRPATGRSFGPKTAAGRPFGARPGAKFPPKPGWKKPEAQQWPPYKRPPAPRPEEARRPAPEPAEDSGPKKQYRLHIEPVQDYGRSEQARPPRPGFSRPPSGSSGPSRSGSDRPRAERSGSGTGRSSSSRPFRSEGGMARPFTTSSGKPRAGGARPSSKPGKEGGRSHGGARGARAGEAARPSFAPKRPVDRQDSTSTVPPSRPERRTGAGWKPKPNFSGKPGGGNSRAGSGDRSKPKTGGFSKSGYKGKPSGPGAKRTGPRPGGKHPGGKRP